jgi:hypothetical protein
VETIVAHNTNYVRGGILTEFATNLSRGLGGVLEGKTLSINFELLATITRVVGTP